MSQVRVSQTSEDGWVGDFVPVQVEDGKNGAVASRIQKLIGVPTGSERASLGFAIANDTANQQVRIVERGTIGVGNRVAEFAAFVDRAGRLWRNMAGDSAGK